MAKKAKVQLPSRRPAPKGRVRKPHSFALHPDTLKRLRMTIAEGSTSAFVEQAIITALDAVEGKISTTEGAEIFELPKGDMPQE